MGGRKKVRENANITFVFPNGRKCDTLDTLACCRNAGTNVDHHCAHSPMGGCGHIILNTAVLFSPVGGCGHIILNTAVLFSPMGGCGHIVLNAAVLFSPMGGCGQIILNTAVLFSPMGGCGYTVLSTAVVGGCGYTVLSTALLFSPLGGNVVYAGTASLERQDHRTAGRRERPAGQ